MAATEAAKEALWLKGLIKELNILQGGDPLLCDNQSAIFWQRTRSTMRGQNILMCGITRSGSG